MKQRTPFLNPKSITLVVLMVASVLSLLFMQYLIATPKVLFGRSLSAISPGLFPTIVLILLAVMCAATLWFFKPAEDEEEVVGLTRNQWIRAVTFFGIMILYGMIMVPFGFLISTAIATTLISLQLGTRSIIQIVGVALVAPVLLYLAATQLLAVSLPELDVIEMTYSRTLDLFSADEIQLETPND